MQNIKELGISPDLDNRDALQWVHEMRLSRQFEIAT
jgi:hypothetical protein